MEIGVTREFQRPRKALFARISEPERMGALIEELGGQVESLHVAEASDAGSAGVGTTWRGTIAFRGAPRKFTLTLAEVRPGRALRYLVDTPQAELALVLEFIDRAGGGTEVCAQATPRPKGLLGRIAVQALRLMPGKAQGRLRRAIVFLARAA